jgi:uncharacterized protein with HEPN domain
MQPGIKNDLVYVLLILESIGKVEIYSANFPDALSFFNENAQMNFDASLLLLSNIGEQSAKISKELQQKNPGIDWIKIKALRNRIAHDYTGMDFEKTFLIIRKDLHELKLSLHSIIRDELVSGNFSREELEVAAKSAFYKHVDFLSLKE